jgi:hypothetical protein
VPFSIGVEVGDRVVGETEGGFVLGETVLGTTGVTGGAVDSTFVGEDVGIIVLVGEEDGSLVVGCNVDKLVGEREGGMLVGRGVAIAICSFLPLSFSNKESPLATALSDRRLSLVRTTGKTTMRMIATVPKSNSSERVMVVMRNMIWPGIHGDTHDSLNNPKHDNGGRE